MQPCHGANIVVGLGDENQQAVLYIHQQAVAGGNSQRLPRPAGDQKSGTDY